MDDWHACLFMCSGFNTVWVAETFAKLVGGTPGPSLDTGVGLSKDADVQQACNRPCRDTAFHSNHTFAHPKARDSAWNLPGLDRSVLQSYKSLVPAMPADARCADFGHPFGT